MRIMDRIEERIRDLQRFIPILKKNNREVEERYEKELEELLNMKNKDVTIYV